MATSTKTASKTTKTIVTTLKKPSEIAVAALDAYLTAEDRATAASAKKKTTKAILMGVTSHDEIVTASDGRVRKIENHHVPTNQHEKLVGILAAELGYSDAQLKKLYKKHAGSKHVQEAKKF